MTPMPDTYLVVGPEGVTARLPISLFQEGGGDSRCWVGRCPVLAISAQGDTAEEAEDAVKEAIDIVLRDVLENGTLEQLLTQELGWSKMEPSDVEPQQVRFAFPVPETIKNVDLGPIAVRT